MDKVEKELNKATLNSDAEVTGTVEGAQPQANPAADSKGETAPLHRQPDLS